MFTRQVHVSHRGSGVCVTDGIPDPHSRFLVRQPLGPRRTAERVRITAADARGKVWSSRIARARMSPNDAAPYQGTAD